MIHGRRPGPVSPPGGGRRPALRFVLALAVTFGGGLVLPPPAVAATLDVCLAGCPFTSIQAAVDAAAAGDVIEVGDGVYTETVALTKDLTIAGTGATLAVVDAGGAGSTITVAAGVTATIEDLTLRGGAALAGAGVDNAGTLTLRRVQVNGNVATDPSSVADGGGIANAGVLTIEDSSIAGNTADRGGGVWNGGGTVTIERSFVAENVARNHGGGGIAAALSSARLTVSDTVIAGNRVIAPGTDQRGGGGVWVSQADVVLDGVEVIDNTSGYSAGGIYISGSATQAQLVRTVVAGNTNGTDRGVGRGGGISARSSAQVTITESTVSGNSAAGSGGGIEASTTLTIANSTVSGNASAGSGGGIAVDGAVTLDSVTVAGNSAQNGGGIADVGRTPIVRNSVVGGNSAVVSGPDCYGDLFVDAAQFVLVGTTTACIPGGSGTVLTGDPQLGPLQDNGGPTETMLPGVASPLIDAGATALITDQRGAPRPFGVAADIGAVELQGVPTPEADLSIAMTPRSLDISAGLSETYEVTVFNDGPSDATAVFMTLQFSGEIQPLALPAECIDQSTDGRVLCVLSALVDGSLHTFSLPILFPSGGTQTVTASVEADEDDPDTDDAEVIGFVQVIGGSGADVGAALAIDSGENTYGQLLAGAPIVVNVAATNRGPNDATDVSLELTVPQGWTLDGLDPRCTIGFPDVGIITCDFGDIPRPFDPRFPNSRLAQIGLVPSGPADVVAQVSTTATDPFPGNDVATLTVDDVLSEVTDLSVRTRLAPPAAYVLGESTVGLPIELRKTPDDVATNPRFSVTVTPSIGVVGLRMAQLGFRWSCSDISATKVDCQATSAEAIPEDFVVELTVDDIGDVDFRDYEIEVAAQARDAFELDPSNDVDTGFLTFRKPPPIDVVAMEVTQAVQDWELSVDLVAGKQTAVRVFLEDTVVAGGRAGGELRATRNGVPLVPASVAPLSDTQVPTDAVATRKELSLSLMFLLPDSWTTEGDVDIEYVIASEFGRDANCLEPVGPPDCRVRVEFLPEQVVALDLLPISYVTDEVQQVVLTDPIEPDGDDQVAASGTFTISDGTETTGDIAHDASPADVEAAIEALTAFSSAEVSVRKIRGADVDDDERGWRVSLRQQQDLPLLTVDGGDLDDATIAVRAGYDGGRLVQITATEMFEQIGRLESVLPISGTDIDWYFPPTFDYMPITYADVNPYLESYRVAQLVGCPGGCRPQGLRVGGYMNGGGIEGSGGNNDGAVFSVYTGGEQGPGDSGYARNRGPHELAHSFGKSHSVVEELDATTTIGLCGAIGRPEAELHPYVSNTSVENPDLELDDYGEDAWPTIGPLNTGVQREVWGLDVRLVGSGSSSGLTIQDPRSVASLMSYCDGGNQSRWPSKFGYEFVYDGIANGTVGFPEDDGTVDDRLIVTGTIDDETGEVEFGRIVGVRGVRPLPADGGVVEVSLVDESGGVLDRAIVELQHDDSAGDRPADEPANEPRTRLFSAVVDAPGADVAALVVSSGGEELGRVAASPSAPTVAIDTPTGGDEVGGDGLTIEWTAADDDGDELTADVYYSPGGDEWRPIALGASGDRLSVPLSSLGQSDDARVRIVVSDGLRTATATSGAFTVADAPSTVEITSPAAGAVVSDDSALVLDAIAIDPEDGRLDGATAIWRSDIAGELGVGTPLTVPAGVLVEACHRISVTISDSAGNESIATTTVGVGRACAAGESTGEITVVQTSPASPELVVGYTTTAASAPAFELVDAGSRTFAAAAGPVVVTQDVPDGHHTSIVCHDPSGGSQVDPPAGRATVDLDPGESVTCAFTTVPISSPAAIDIAPSSTTVQVGDAVETITVAIVDLDSPPSAISVSVDALPPGLAAGDLSCTATGRGSTCELDITGTATGPPATHLVGVEAADGTSTTRAIATVIVAREDALVRLPGSNPTNVVIEPGGDGAVFEVIARTVEREPDLATGTPGVTDLDGADVTMRLEPVGPGGTVVPSECGARMLGDLGDQTLVTTCRFSDVVANTYAVVAVAGGDFAGRAEDVLVVHELGDGSTRGAGEIAAADGATLRFAFDMEYSGNGKNPKGALMVVRTEADGAQHVVRSNSIGGLTFGAKRADPAWASFTGKATYAAPGEEPVGNHEFVAYAEDGSDDRFWFQLRGRDGAVLDEVGLPGDGVGSAIPLTSGEIQVAG